MFTGNLITNGRGFGWMSREHIFTGNPNVLPGAFPVTPWGQGRYLKIRRQEEGIRHPDPRER